MPPKIPPLNAPPLRPGWTTGACATAATKAACIGLFTGDFPERVSLLLPHGETAEFPLALAERDDGWTRVGILKDAGDDPDVTHGATIVVTVRLAAPGTGVVFRAGAGVGRITKPGLALAPGEPAINPVPRRLMTAEVRDAAARHGAAADVEIEISVPGGEEIARKTWNPRLGILGGISILGTTGVVVPYSCSAWIHSIRRGIDVARATGVTHVAACTGSTSEKAVRDLRGLPEDAIIDMGDFVGGTLTYLRRHPLPRVTLAGGFAKLSKLAAGQLDLHSRRSQVDLPWLAGMLHTLAAERRMPAEPTACTTDANSALEILERARAAGLPLGDHIAAMAERVARQVLGDAPIDLDVLAFDRRGNLVGVSRQETAGGRGGRHTTVRPTPA